MPIPIEEKIPIGEKAMEEVLGKNEGAVSPTNIFLCYAHEDETFLEQLEEHLAPLKRQRLITSWYDRDIRAGTVWEQEIHDHLDNAQLVLLLVSPSFMSSDYCYSVEMTHALERQSRGESHVIPVIVRPVYWQGEPLGKLQVLPTDGKPVASWSNRDEAFFDVVEGIRRVIEQRETQPTIFPLSDQQQENGGKKRQNVDVLEQEILSKGLLAEYKAHQELTDVTSPEKVSQLLIHSPSKTPEDKKYHPDGNIYKRNHRNIRKRRLLISAAILLALVLSLVRFLPLPTCSFAFCHSSSQPTKQPSPQHEKQALSVERVTVVSPAFVISDDSKPSTSISAVLLSKNTPTYDTIIISVRDLRYGGTDIFIDYVALKLLSILEIPLVLKVWTPGVATTYSGYSYPVTYTGQQPDQLLYAQPPKPVILAPAGPNQAGESASLSLQILSTRTAYLLFRVEIAYQITDQEQMLILPQTFRVVFSNAANWHKVNL
jgi:hypothetical protein